jgi:hypothetical protein
MATLVLHRQRHAHRQFLTAVHTLALVRLLEPVRLAERLEAKDRILLSFES